jgi:hypothetical protein
MMAIKRGDFEWRNDLGSIYSNSGIAACGADPPFYGIE